MAFSVLPRSRWARWRFAVLLAVFSVLTVWQLGLPAARLLAYTPQEGDLVFQSLPHNPLIDAIENGGLPLDRLMITPVEVTRDPRLTEILRQGL